MKKKRVTMQDIADELNISKVSVYKALSDKQDISDNLKNRVVKYATKANYKTIDPLAKLCKKVFYLLPREFSASTEQFYSGIYLEISKGFALRNIPVEHVIVDKNFSVKKFIASINMYQKQDATKFSIIWAGIIHSHILKEFIDLSIPIVCIDNYKKNFNGSYIYLDVYHAGYSITNYLIRKNHKKICFVIKTQVSTNIDKFLGFQKALMQNNIPFTENMHIDLSLADMNSFKIFKLPDELPTAFMFDSDLSARNFMLIMLNQGYKIPEDFSVVSFDNTYLCEETIPKLTSIGVKNNEIVDAVYKVLLKRLSTKELKPFMMYLNFSIIERDSVKTI